MNPYAGKQTYLFYWLQQRLVPSALWRDWEEEVPPLVEFAELAKGGGDGNFGKGENMGTVTLGKEWTPVEFLVYAGTVPDFFTCPIAFTSQTNTKN